MCLMPAPKSEKSWPICCLPVARPHLGKNTCASSANKSRMLPPLDVLPPLSNAFRYSSATDLRCSSVIVSFEIATASLLSAALHFGRDRAQLGVQAHALAVTPAAQRSNERAALVERQRRDVSAEGGPQPV